ncbi:MAG: DUF134 domain-containing protein [Bacillota bacterium]|nr:DUF134 domain-containing protein [Bacillota bacterium]
MPRPPIFRKVAFLPNFTYFKPAGVPLKNLEEECLGFEELEAIRLKDLEGLEQEACAEKMGISRPTFHRIITLARNKLARALVEGKAIRIEGGNYTLIMDELLCSNCGYLEKIEDDSSDSLKVCPRSKQLKCPRCGSSILLKNQSTIHSKKDDSSDKGNK